ncbi:polysaccharide pyruvyl transferase family protein [Desulfogranum marinum]|uniref:polysaccharide pyruvyl transferase family protein n=1 Tax=Desulfogranum marinum TaxID=453220 RepID=UPI0029C88A58|nr:polysaccharide pyruvyl transferase family protein [Desulfogranum marinum]
MKYLISGVAITGNKGASGMAEALIQNISKKDSEAFFYIMSYYPKADVKTILPHKSSIINGSPKSVVLLFFSSIWIFAGRLLHLPKKLYIFNTTLKAIEQCDYWLDASGISFVDGREKFLIFNVLSILPGLALKKKIVKVSQALGPFNSTINRFVAKLILPRLSLICSRGEQTSEHLRLLGLSQNIKNYPDITFSLQLNENNFKRIEKYIPKDTNNKIIGVSPSQVMYELCNERKIDYLSVLSAHIEMLHNLGNDIIIFPHSIRINTQATHNNDMLVLKKLVQMLPQHVNITLVTDDLSAADLRALISKCDILVASRFHALISALAVNTPVLVLGWSHKYREVLRQFDLEKYSLSFDNMHTNNLNLLYNLVLENYDEIRSTMSKSLTIVTKRCNGFYDELVALEKHSTV